MKPGLAVLGLAATLALAATAVRAGLDDAKAQDLLKQGGCVACHSIDKKIVGPSFREVALKRKGQNDAAAVIEKSVRAGSKGTYGQMPMPPNPAQKIGDAELHELAEWVLTK